MEEIDISIIGANISMGTCLLRCVCGHVTKVWRMDQLLMPIQCHKCYRTIRVFGDSIFPHNLDMPNTYQYNADDSVDILEERPKRSVKRDMKHNPLSRIRKPKFRDGLAEQIKGSTPGDGYTGQYHPDRTPTSIKTDIPGWFYNEP